MNKRNTSILIVLVSPIIIIIIGNLAARIFLDLLGKWAWIGYFPVYWSMLFLVTFFGGKRENHRIWFRSKQRDLPYRYI